MKKKNTLLIALLFLSSICYTQLAFGQTKNKIYFSEFGGTAFMDYFSSKLAPLTGDFDFKRDANYNPINSPGTGYIKYNVINFISLNYTARINIYEFNKDRSISIDMPISVGFGVGFKDAFVISNDSITSDLYYNYRGHRSAEGTTIFNLNIPVFITYNMGMGSTYVNDSDKGFAIGLGFDCAHPLLFIDGRKSFDEYLTRVKKSNFYFIPAISLGYRYWKGERPLELNLKLGFAPSDANEAVKYLSPSGLTNGLSMRLSFNKILNF